MTRSSVLRRILAGLALLIMATCVIATAIIASQVSIDDGIADMPFNDLATKSIDSRLDLSRSLFQMALLVTGALWGLIIAKKDETRIVFSQFPEMIMFTSGSILLLLSLGAHTIYVNNLSHYLAEAAQAYPKSPADKFLSLPNIFDQNVNYLFILQVTNLIAGIGTAVITLISAHRLKEV